MQSDGFWFMFDIAARVISSSFFVVVFWTVSINIISHLLHAWSILMLFVCVCMVSVHYIEHWIHFLRQFSIISNSN